MHPITVLALDLALGVPRLEPARVGEPPAIDGRLDDAAWRAAPVTDELTQRSPHPGVAPTERTTVRVLYDAEAVYFGVECEHRRTRIVRRLTRRDREIETDVVSVDLDTRRDGLTAFSFVVSVAGVLGDGIRFNDTDYTTQWDENWEAATARTRRGWSVEMRIPLRVLRFDAAGSQTWGLQVRRYVSALQEIDEWSFIPPTAAGEVSRYGRLGPFEGLEPDGGLELRPAVVARTRRRDPNEGSLASGWDSRGQVGVDAKWHVSQDLTLDATFLPDFGQVEADQVVLNLSTFETQFPEKRTFFLEGQDTFTTPIQVLYTRRIGAPPASPSLEDGEELVDTAEPSTIYGAGKLVGRIGRTGVGALWAVTGPDEVEVQTPDGARSPRLLAPVASFGVLRLLRELGGGSSVGLMAAGTLRLEPPNRYPQVEEAGEPASLCPDGERVEVGARCFHDAFVAGLDGRWRSPSGDWVAAGQALGSLVRGRPERSLADGTVVASGDVAPGGRLRVAKEGGEHWIGAFEYEGYGRKLSLDDLGYLRRQNMHRVFGALGYQTTQPAGPTLESRSYVEVYHYWNLDWLAGPSGYQVNTWVRFRNRARIFTELHYRPSYFDDREMGDGAALEREGLVGLELWLGFDQGGPVTFDGGASLQRIWNGYNFEFGAEIGLRIAPELDLALGPQVGFTDGEPRFVEAGDDPGSYVFGRQRARSVGAILRATWAFGPRLTLQVYAQLLVAAVHFDDWLTNESRDEVVELDELADTGAPSENPDFLEGALNASAVLRWEWRLGSTLFLVYSRAQAPEVGFEEGAVPGLDPRAVTRGPAADVLLLKLSYWWG
ncbi:MAG: hypothetical protein HYY06_31870 [Deltaproteobacteria bacterium]|nr:hypothetical protein [Deltaproteobacteria bacterium]